MSIFMQYDTYLRCLNQGPQAALAFPTVSAKLVAPRSVAGFGNIMWYLEAITAGTLTSNIREMMGAVPNGTALESGITLATTGALAAPGTTTATMALALMPYIAPNVAIVTGPATGSVGMATPMLSMDPTKYIGSLAVKPTHDALGTFANALIQAETYPFVPKPLRNCAGFIYLKGDRQDAADALAAADAVSVVGPSDLQSLPYAANAPTMARMRLRVDSGTWPNNQMQTIAFQLFGTPDWVNWYPTGVFKYIPGGAPTGHVASIVNAAALNYNMSPWADVSPYLGLSVVAMSTATLGAVTGSLRTYIDLDFAL